MTPYPMPNMNMNVNNQTQPNPSLSIPPSQQLNQSQDPFAQLSQTPNEFKTSSNSG